MEKGKRKKEEEDEAKKQEDDKAVKIVGVGKNKEEKG